MSWRQFGLALAFLSISVPAFGADMGLRPAQCSGEMWSPILTLSSPDKIRAEVKRRYEEALSASESPHVIASRRQIYDWAIEAKISCAKAIGFLKYNEVNQYQIGQCDCYYGRMYMLSH